MSLKIISVTLSVLLVWSCQSPNKNESSEQLDISGTWVGIAYEMSDIPEEPNVSITFAFYQSNGKVTGSFYYSEYTDSVTDGSITDNVLLLKTNTSTVDNIYYQFEGTVIQDSIGGNWSIVNLNSGEAYTTHQWYVKKETQFE